VLAACSSSAGDDEAGSDDTAASSSMAASETAGGTLTVALDGARELPLGEPLELTLTLTNPGTRSVAAPVDVSLVSPDGTRLPFYRTSLFVPFGQSASEAVTVTTSRWYTETGDFEVVAEVTDTAIAATAASHPFTVVPSDRSVPKFEDVTAQAGLVTDVPVPECGQFSNGAAWADVDGDGWQDLLVTRLGDPVQLFVNHGDGTFGDETAERGVVATGANGAAFADYDNDGDPDLALVGDGPDRLLQNDGTGHFVDVTATAGVAGDPASRGMSATWGDFDSDGLLDLYVTNYMECTGPWTTAADIITNVAYHLDVLYHNEGDGTFRVVTSDLLGSDSDAAGFTAAWLDVDSDNRLDLFVANDFVGLSPDHNRLWHNDGPGTAGHWAFSDVSLASGAGLYMNTMGAGIADVDRDGDLDMALSNIGGNKLLRSQGDGTFVEETRSGIERPNQGIDYFTVTWASVFYDLDLDGWEDLFMTAGNLPQGPDVVVGKQPNMVFQNDGTGMRFLDISALTGADDVNESKGAAFADYDNDGAMDVFVVNQAGAPRLYRNVTPRGENHWLEVDPAGTVSNRDGCGARITAVVAGQAIMRQVLCGSGGSGSSHQRQVHFGLGTATAIDRIEVLWSSGTKQTVDNPPADQMVTVEEPHA
jgi:enediyne biosynthesis protein E4